METFTIGQLAKKSRVNVETVRYYERRGLIPEPPRLHKSQYGSLRGPGYRQYTKDYVIRIRFIRRAQELGFSLKEIQELLSLQTTADSTCDIRAFINLKITDIEEKIRDLLDMQDVLTKFVSRCTVDGPVSECPILKGIDENYKITVFKPVEHCLFVPLNAYKVHIFQLSKMLRHRRTADVENVA